MTLTKTNETGIYRDKKGRLVAMALITVPRKNKRVKRQQTMSPDATIEEAKAAREALIKEVRGEPEQTSPRPLLGEYAIDWIERRSRRLKPSTEALYRTILASYLIPFLGDLYVDSLRRSDVEDLATHLEGCKTRQGKQLAHKTMRSYWRVCCILLKDLAADHGMPDPTLRVDPPTSKRRGIRERRTLTREQLAYIIEWVRDSDCTRTRKRHAEVLTLAYTGIRSGELWALKTDALDGERMTIRASISDGVWTDVTKTGWEREVYRPDVVQLAHAEHRRAMVAEQHTGLASGLLFPSSSGRPRSKGSLRPVLEAASKALARREEWRGDEAIVVTPQVLRRTYNTLMVQGGVDRIVLQAQMGHADEAMTKLYAGVQIEAKRDAVNLAILGQM